MPRELSWMPAIDDRAGPKYLRIADALAEDIYAGRLSIGERLPTHRDLAWELGVTVGTVSRAYAEAERRGLLTGEVGRGSYVRSGARSQATLAMPDIAGPARIELGINRPPTPPEVTHAFATAMTELASDPVLPDLLNYQAHTGRWQHRQAGARYLGRRGLSVGPDQVLVTSGAQHAIAAAFMAFCAPGDTVLVEALTWSGTRALAGLTRLNLVPVAMDAQGIDPDAFDGACRATGSKLFYTIPTIQNPTCAVLPEDRRRRVAEIARRHGVTIIEDDIYADLFDTPPPPLAAFAPERTVHLSAASKTLTPALRVGFVALPEDRVGRFSAASRASNWMAPPVMGEITARWLEDGTAAHLASLVRAEAGRRHRIAEACLGAFHYRRAENSFHIWLDLPEPWRAEDLIRAADGVGISMASTDLFVPGRGETPHAVRVTLTGPDTAADLERGLTSLAGLMRQTPEVHLAVA